MGAERLTESLDGQKYCLLITFRRSGDAVPTAVWFGVAGDKLYVRTDRAAGKVKRIRGNARVQIAPCTLRGRQLGPAIDGVARVVDSDEEDLAEHALRARYGLFRRFYQRFFGARHAAYIEVAPATE